MKTARWMVGLGCVVGAPALIATAVGASAGAWGEEEPSAKATPAAAGDQAGAVSTIAAIRRGAAVALSGTVIRVSDRDEFRLSDGTGSIRVRLSWAGPSPVAVGDVVRVEGVVVDEKTFGLSRPEVLASALRLPGGATVTFAAPGAPDAAVAPAGGPAAGEVTPIGRLARGQNATIAGRVTDIVDVDEFRIQDASGSVRVYVGWQNRVGVRVGESVRVTGVMDDEPWPIPAEFYADSVVPEDGRTIELRLGTEGAAPAVDGGVRPGADRPAGSVPTTPSRIADVRPYDTVLLRGVVEAVTDEDEFRLRDDSGSIEVYIGWRNAMPVRAGEQVSVVGMVDAQGPGGMLREVYAHELVTGAGARVDLQPQRGAAQPSGDTPAAPRSTPPSPPASAPPSAPGNAASPAAPAAGGAPADAAVIPISSVRRGQAVTLRGEVQRLRDSDEFVLRDSTGTIVVYIGWRNRMPVSVGQRVTVIGTADDDVLPGMRPEIYASSVVLADGRVIELIRGGRDE